MYMRRMAQYKYVYPALLLLMMFLLVLGVRTALGQDNAAESEVNRRGENTQQDDWDWLYPDRASRNRRHGEAEFLRDADRFTSNVAYENGIPGSEMVNRVFGDSESVADMRYRRDVERLNQARDRADERYHERRRDMESRLSSYNRDSEDYRALHRQLQDLDRSYRDRSNRLERNYRNLDVRHAETRW